MYVDRRMFLRTTAAMGAAAAGKTGSTTPKWRGCMRVSIRPASDHGNKFEHAPACNNAISAVSTLMAITGNLDRPGGDIFPAGSTMPATQERSPERKIYARVGG